MHAHQYVVCVHEVVEDLDCEVEGAAAQRQAVRHARQPVNQLGAAGQLRGPANIK